jgi:cbb3-type cytochrome oxidase maturation protein
VSFLIVTVPVSLLLAGCLLGLVILAVRSGAFDDWEGPAQRLLYDDDETPEIDAAYRELPAPDGRERD